MVIEHILKDESLDLAPYIAGHTGDRTVTYKVVDNEASAPLSGYCGT